MEKNLVEILIDTNFILTATKQKIHLEEQLKQIFGAYRLIVPQQVIDELKKISDDKKEKLIYRNSANISIQIIKLQKFKIIKLEKKDADAGIINYSKDKPELIIATLDKVLKQKIKKANPKIKFLTIKQKTQLSIQ